MYNSIPTQLSLNKKRYVISNATGKRTTEKDREILSELVDSKTVLISYNTTDPGVSLSLTTDEESYKMYLSDTGLFTTLLFNSADKLHTKIYAKLLSDKLDANLGYLYENAAAQMITASGNKLFYHTCDGGHQAIRLDENRRPVLDGRKCVGCHLCALVCPQRAIFPAKKRLARER